MLGLFDPLAVLSAAERLGNADVRFVILGFNSPYRRGCEAPDTFARFLDLLEAVLTSTSRGTLARLQLLRQFAERWAGAGKAEQVFEAFCSLNEALRLKDAVCWHLHAYYGGVSRRYMTRPLVIKPELLTPEEEAISCRTSSTSARARREATT